MTAPPPLDVHAQMADRADRAGLRRIHIFAFRDRDDPDAGGSEEHASQVGAQLVAAGREVVLHTSKVPGAPAEVGRSGMRVVRRGGRFGVFATSPFDERSGRLGRADGLIEVFHGVPFFVPLWSRLPHVGVVHHVHLGTWDMLLPGPLGRVGEAVERHLVPRVYRDRTLLTAAPSARDEIVQHYRLPADRIWIAPHGVDARFTPGGERSTGPLVVAVARLMPQKGIPDLLRALVRTKQAVPDLRAAIVGDGPYRAEYVALSESLGASSWVHFTGRAGDDELVGWYRKAWVVASASLREGFGLTLTEAAACGTPVVATRIPGHVDAVAEDVSGLLASSTTELGDLLAEVLTDHDLRKRLSEGALEHSARFRWERAAATLLDALCRDAERRR